MTCEEARLALGVRVLGALEADEREQVDRHVERCPSCAAELAALAGLPGLLAAAGPPDAVTRPVGPADPARPPSTGPPSTGQPSTGLLERLLSSAAAERAAERGASGRRRRVTAAAALASAAALVAVVTMVELGGGPPAVTASGVTPATHVAVQVSLHPRAWGTALDVRLHGVAPGQHCRLVVIARGGGQEVAATWKATYEGRADISGATAIPAASVVAVSVLADDGRTLARVPLAG